MDVTLDYLQENAIKLTRGVTDDEDHFERWVEYELADGRKYRLIADRFTKVNPFAEPDSPDADILTELNGVRVVRKSREMFRTVGHSDDPDKYACWVEYHLPGHPQPVHRSVDIRFKRTVGAAEATVGNFR